MIDLYGFDPGKVTGWCRLKVDDEALTWQLVGRGEIHGTTLLRYLVSLRGIMPDAHTVAIEKPFLGHGADMLDLAERWALIKLHTEMLGASFMAITPATARRVVVGTGAAKDNSVTAVVRDLIGAPSHAKKGEGLGQHQPAAIACALAVMHETYGIALEARNGD